MLKDVFSLARPMLLALEPERAHEATLKSLEAGFYPKQAGPDPGSLAQDLLGLHFPNPLGIAAGFDKNARVPSQILNLGLGFAEIGTVTPEPQAGNPRPRVFRLIKDRGVINRLGFNNEGHAAALRRLEQREPGSGIVGVNIGANKDATDRIADYVAGLETFYRVASYFTVNVSSPNTPGLRDLQAPAALDDLLARLLAARQRLIDRGQPQRPIIVKLAPDIVDEDLPAITDRLVAHKVEGICVSNTTLARDHLGDPVLAKQAGGLSGRPLFERATRMLARVYELTDGSVTLIGVGGIDSGDTALAKVEAGASLLQLYTGLIFEGPSLVDRIKQRLDKAVAEAGFQNIGELVGRRAKDWVARPVRGSAGQSADAS
ncbi:MAG: quinone-dependent dihydroorotate dehydrogenase [Hyphomicrobiaceae bacterium]